VAVVGWQWYRYRWKERIRAVKRRLKWVAEDGNWARYIRQKASGKKDKFIVEIMWMNILVRGGGWQWVVGSSGAWRWKEGMEAVKMRLEWVAEDGNWPRYRRRNESEKKGKIKMSKIRKRVNGREMRVAVVVGSSVAWRWKERIKTVVMRLKWVVYDTNWARYIRQKASGKKDKFIVEIMWMNILVRGGGWQWFFDSGVAWRWKERIRAVAMV
jgi:hypothetical protein